MDQDLKNKYLLEEDKKSEGGNQDDHFTIDQVVDSNPASNLEPEQQKKKVPDNLNGQDNKQLIKLIIAFIWALFFSTVPFLSPNSIIYAWGDNNSIRFEDLFLLSFCGYAYLVFRYLKATILHLKRSDSSIPFSLKAKIYLFFAIFFLLLNILSYSILPNLGIDFSSANRSDYPQGHGLLVLFAMIAIVIFILLNLLAALFFAHFIGLIRSKKAGYLSFPLSFLLFMGLTYFTFWAGPVIRHNTLSSRVNSKIQSSVKDSELKLMSKNNVLIALKVSTSGRFLVNDTVSNFYVLDKGKEEYRMIDELYNSIPVVSNQGNIVAAHHPTDNSHVEIYNQKTKKVISIKYGQTNEKREFDRGVFSDDDNFYVFKTISKYGNKAQGENIYIIVDLSNGKITFNSALELKTKAKKFWPEGDCRFGKEGIPFDQFLSRCRENKYYPFNDLSLFNIDGKYFVLRSSLVIDKDSSKNGLYESLSQCEDGFVPDTNIREWNKENHVGEASPCQLSGRQVIAKYDESLDNFKIVFDLSSPDVKVNQIQDIKSISNGKEVVALLKDSNNATYLLYLDQNGTKTMLGENAGVLDKKDNQKYYAQTIGIVADK